MKKVLSVLLCAVLVLSGLSLTGLSAFAAGATVTLELSQGVIAGDVNVTIPEELFGNDLSAVLPIPSKKDEAFLGWYADAECTQKIEQASADLSGKTLYAGWGTVDRAVGFEFGSNSDVKDSSLFTISNEVYYQGSASVKFHPSTAGLDVKGNWNAGSSLGASFGISNIKAYKDGDVSYSAGGRLNQLPYGQYRVTFRYKAESLDEGKTLYVALGTHKCNSTNYSVWNYSSRYSDYLAIDQASDDWKTAELILTVRSQSGDPQSPVLMVFPTKDGSQSASYDPFLNTTVYFDDFVFEKAIDVTYVLEDGSTQIQPVFSGNKIVFPTAGGVINRDDGTGYALGGAKWFSDPECTQEIDTNTQFATGEGMVFYRRSVKAVDDGASQEAFNSFELTEDVGNKAVLAGFTTTEAGYCSNRSITALKATKEISLFDQKGLKDADYLLNFTYRSEKGCVIRLAGAEQTLPASADWTVVSFPVRPVNGAVLFSFVSGGKTSFDNFSAALPVDTAGISTLTREAQEQAQGQALRMYGAYHVNENGKIIIGNREYSVIQRGFVFHKLGQTDFDANSKNVFVFSKDENLDSCWSFEDGLLTYSVYADGFDTEDVRVISFRSFVVLDDGNTYYSPATVSSVTEAKACHNLSSNAATYSFTDAAVRDKTVINGRYDVVDDGITMDYNSSGVRMNVRAVGKMTFRFTGNLFSNAESFYMTLLIDGKRVPMRYRLPVNQKGAFECELTVDLGSSSAVRSIELYRQAQATFGTMTLCSVSFAGTLEQAEEQKLIEFIGDSITTGFGNLTRNGLMDDRSTLITDGTSAYAFLTAKNLGVDHRILSQSGIGVHFSAGGGTSKGNNWTSIYEYENYMRNDAPYTCERQADVVSIFLGTNDNWARTQGKASYTTEELAGWMKELISTVKKDNPNAKIVWATTTSFENSAQLALEELGGEEQGYYLFRFGQLDGYQAGGGYHPTAACQQEMANRYTAFLKEKLFSQS